MIRRLILALALGFSGQALAQPLNKCVDPAGKTTYTQSPCPPNSKSAPISNTVPPAPAPPAPAAGETAKGDGAKADSAQGAAAKSGPRSTAEADQAFRKRQQDQADARKKQEEKIAEARQKEENCNQARTALAGLEAGGRQVRFDAKGERVFLDDNQIAQEKDKARKSVEQACK
jgi:hypothetical protein